MLVIRRRQAEAILIGPDVELEILEITPTRVTLGIRAPETVVILRKEIRLAEQQNRQAALPMEQGAMEKVLAKVRGGEVAGQTFHVPAKILPPR